jgi:hypothetical protein
LDNERLGNVSAGLALHVRCGRCVFQLATAFQLILASTTIIRDGLVRNTGLRFDIERVFKTIRAHALCGGDNNGGARARSLSRNEPKAGMPQGGKGISDSDLREASRRSHETAQSTSTETDRAHSRATAMPSNQSALHRGFHALGPPGVV